MGSSLRLLLIILVTVVAVEPALAAPAPAAPLTYRLVFAGGKEGAGCLDRQGLARAVDATLGRSPWSLTARRQVVVTLRRQGSRLLVEVRLLDERGHVAGLRRLGAVAAECAELERALALAISIAIDPTVVLTPVAAVSRRKRASAARVGAARPTLPRVAARRSAPLRLSLGLAGHLALGSAPAPSGGATLSLLARRRWIEFGLEGRLDGFARKGLGEGGVDAALLGGVGLVCGRWRMLFGCTTLTAAALIGGGVQLDDARRLTSLYLAPGLRLGAQLPLAGRFFLRGGAQLDVPLRRARYRDSSSGTALWSAPPVAALFGLGLGVRLR